jgi:hypothetical protein
MDPIAIFLARGGRIQRCPTAAVTTTTGSPSADDAAMLAEHAQRADEADAAAPFVFGWRPAKDFVPRPARRLHRGNSTRAGVPTWREAAD